MARQLLADALGLLLAARRVPLARPAAHAHLPSAAVLLPPHPAHAAAHPAAQAPHPEQPPMPAQRSQLHAAPVPRTRIGRLYQFGTLAAGVGVGMAAEAFKRATGLSSSGSSDASSLAFSKSNVDRIVSRLSLMRGAALKMGQMLSIQDNKLLSPEIETIFRRVQDSANYMPQWQLESVLHKELGQDWLSRFSSFDMIPIAAASIGQVHKAQLITGEHVAVKVQYPGVADSIASDLANLKSLLLVGNLLPRGLYLDNTIRVAQLELGWECDYLREAQASDRFAESIARAGIRGFHVPKVFHDHTTARVLTSEFVDGVPMDKTASLDQQSRNRLGDRLFRLCLSELFTFRFMQTDPNWSNFLYDAKRDRINLIDFGASREFPKAFTDDYLRLLHASSIRDRDGCIHWSRKLGFLTGFESETMNNAHVTSLQNLSRPFMADAEATYDFSNASELASQVRSAIPVMLRERLTPPPDESYSLHRKLSGCFLLCTHLRAQIPCKSIFQDTFRAYRFDNIEG